MESEGRISRIEKALQELKVKQENDISQVYEHLQYMRYDVKIKALENKIRDLEYTIEKNDQRFRVHRDTL